MKIDGNILTGRIKELHSQFGLEFFYTDEKKQAIRYLKQIEDNCKNSISVDIETSGLNIVTDVMLGIAIGFSTKKALYISVREMSDSDALEIIKYINNMKNKIIMHNAHFDCSFTGSKYGTSLRFDYDIMIYAYCLYTHLVYKKISIGLKELTRRFTPFGDYEEELVTYKKEYCKKNKIKLNSFSYDLIPDNILSPYALMDGISTLVLFNIFMKEKINFINNGWTKLDSLIDVKHKVTEIYTEAKIRGFKIDRNKVMELYKEWKSKSEEIYNILSKMKEVKDSEKIIKRSILVKAQSKRKSILPLTRCRKLWKEAKFNFNSSDHLKILFYEVLKLEVIKKTDTGEPSTDSEVIEHYSEKGIEFMKILNEYGTYIKGISSFLGVEKEGEDEEKGLWNLCSESHPYVHANTNHCGTVSSRTATSVPNYSQVPSRGALKQVKKCYIVDDDRKIIGFDYSSAEMYIATAISQEENYFNIINNNLDFHSVNALAFEDRMEEMPKDLCYEDKLKFIKENYGATWRYYAKALGFSLLYGGTEHSVSKTLSISKKQAKEIVDAFLRKNRGINQYIEDTKDFVCKNGYVENFRGQRVYLPECKGYSWRRSLVKNYDALAGLRFAINFGIQSANAFILYDGMIKFFNEVKNRNMDIRLITTIYDALYLDVSKKEDSKEVAKLLRECFEVDFFGLKMKIDVSESDTGVWYDWENIKL